MHGKMYPYLKRLVASGVDKGVEQDEDAVILRGSTLNPSCQLEAHWEDPIAVPPQCEFALVFRFVCKACLLADSLHALRAKSHLCEA